MKLDLYDVALLGGALLMIGAVSLVSLPGGVFVTGLMLCAGAILLARR